MGATDMKKTTRRCTDGLLFALIALFAIACEPGLDSGIAEEDHAEGGHEEALVLSDAELEEFGIQLATAARGAGLRRGADDRS